MSLMIAPAAGPSRVTGSDRRGSDSSDGGDQFAEVLAGRTSADATVAGASRRNGVRDDPDSDKQPDKAADKATDKTVDKHSDGADAQGVAMLALAATVIAPNPLRPVAQADAPAGGVAAAAGIPGSAAVTGAGLATAAGIAGTAAGRGTAAGLGAAVPYAASNGTSATADGTAGSGDVAPVGSAGDANTSAVSNQTSMATAGAPNPAGPGLRATSAPAGAQLSGGAGTTDPATTASATTGPTTATSATTAPVQAPVQAAAQAAAAQAAQPAKSPVPIKPGAPDGPGSVAVNGAAHQPGKADAKASAGNGKQDARDGQSTSGQASSAPLDTGQSATQQPAVPSPTVAGLGVANSLAPNPQLTSQPVAAPAGPTVRDYPSVPQPLVHQLAGPVLDVRASGDGSHQLSISLHPAELGPVNLHVKIFGDVMTIQLASTSESAHDAIRAALPQLRHELQSAGLAGVDVSLDFNAGSANSGAAPDSRGGRGGQDSSPARLPQVPVSPPAIVNRPSRPADSGLDRWL